MNRLSKRPHRALRWALVGTLLVVAVGAAGVRYGNDVAIWFENDAPSESVGTWEDGSLINGKRLPTCGANFVAYSRLCTALGRNTVNGAVRDVVLAAYERVGETCPGVMFTYGETGWPRGGRIRPHVTHRNGLSVDFMVPVRDASGNPARFPASPRNKFGYNVEFDDQGRAGELAIDFESMAAHIWALSECAQEQEMGLRRVIFDPELQPLLFATEYGAKIRDTITFSKKRSWVRHDEHYHVDFTLQTESGRPALAETEGDEQDMTATPTADRLAWWKEATFGMFIHWGVYAIPGRGEWIMYQEHIPVDEYTELAERFQPKAYDPAAWVELAKDAGMKYMVLVTRHHDGYCLFDSRVSDSTSVKCAAKRDFVADFVEACRAADMRVGLYYSLVDWRFPGVLPVSVRREDAVYAPMVDQAHAQVRELLTNYGKIDILWYDMMTPHEPELWRSAELNAMARELQPDILINNRAGLPEDFGTPENQVIPEKRAWEACYTMNRSWAYCPHDQNYKPVRELVRLITSCAGDCGNFLLNVSPGPDGRIPTEQAERLREIGKWMRANGAAIYGAGRSPIDAPALGLSSRVGNKVYLMIQRWPGTTLPFAWCGSKVVAARVLGTGQEGRVEQSGDRVWVHDLPEYPPDPYMPVIELEFEGEPKPSDPPYQ